MSAAVPFTLRRAGPRSRGFRRGAWRPGHKLRCRPRRRGSLFMYSLTSFSFSAASAWLSSIRSDEHQPQSRYQALALVFEGILPRAGRLGDCVELRQILLTLGPSGRPGQARRGRYLERRSPGVGRILACRGVAAARTNTLVTTASHRRALISCFMAPHDAPGFARLNPRALL